MYNKENKNCFSFFLQKAFMSMVSPHCILDLVSRDLALCA